MDWNDLQTSIHGLSFVAMRRIRTAVVVYEFLFCMPFRSSPEELLHYSLHRNLRHNTIGFVLFVCFFVSSPLSSYLDYSPYKIEIATHYQFQRLQTATCKIIY